MKKHFFRTTFAKLTFAFVIFGLLPLLLIGMFFILNYRSRTQQVIVSNYNGISSYFEKNVDTVIEDADDAMVALYDYQNDKGENLATILKSNAPQSTKQLAVNQALYDVMGKSNYISGLRFVDKDGNLYSLYYSQDKTMCEDAGNYTTMSVFYGPDLCTRIIQSAFEESKVCVDSDDIMFSVVRNYMDTTSIKSTTSTALGTLYADIDVEEIVKITDDMDLSQAECFVYNTVSGHYLYSQDSQAYSGDADPLAEVKDLLTEESGSFVNDDDWYFYHHIPDTTICTVVRLNSKYVTGVYTESYLFMMVILGFAAAFLFILYLAFSIRMSEPTRQLYEAMEEVEQGNLEVSVHLKSNDEMQYVAEGFNKMTERLREYINQVYVAEICQKDAELNALKMQIQPHYLYNTLDIIRMTALEQNDETTAELLECLAHQLRYVMGEYTDQVRLREELDNIREYFVIMKIRYNNRIMLVINAKDEDCDLVIPKLILQPAVENAIRHGLREKQGNGCVNIHVERKGDHLEIVVMDDGVGMSQEKVKEMAAELAEMPAGHLSHRREYWEQLDLSPEERAKRQHERWEMPGASPENRTSTVGVGLKNVYDRIKLNCGPEYGFTIDSIEGMGTFITFTLPILTENSEPENRVGETSKENKNV